MSGRRRAFIALAAGLALAGLFAATRLRTQSTAGRADVARLEPSPSPAPPPVPVAAALALAGPPDPGATAGPRPLTPTGVARALQVIAKNDQMRGIFARLQPLGLSPEQRDRVVLILAAAALRPPVRSPTLEALRADGRSRPLSPEEGRRVLAEQKRAADQTSRLLRPALASVLTPAQLAQAGLGDGASTPIPPPGTPAAAATTTP